MTLLDDLMRSRWTAVRGVCIGALCSIVSACGGGSSPASTSPPPGNGDSPPSGTERTLSCDGYPRPSTVFINGTRQTYTQACLIVQEFAQVTANVSASSSVGALIAHGRPMLDAYTVYARIVAQAVDEGAATALAKSVAIIVTNDGSISASPDHVDDPQALQIDFEMFTAPSTNLTLTAGVGELDVDGYNATLHLSAKTGNASLQNLQGQARIDIGTGTVDAKLAGSGWTGAGLTAHIQSGNVTVSRPAAYQAAFTARSDLGTASIDDKLATAGQQPAVVSAGSGAPIVLESTVGNVAVVATR